MNRRRSDLLIGIAVICIGVLLLLNGLIERPHLISTQSEKYTRAVKLISWLAFVVSGLVGSIFIWLYFKGKSK